MRPLRSFPIRSRYPGNNKYNAFSLLVDAIEQDFFIFTHIMLLFITFKIEYVMIIISLQPEKVKIITFKS